MQDGWTPLYIAAQNGHVNIVKALIKLGKADVDPIDKVIITLLLHMVYYLTILMLPLLIIFAMAGGEFPINSGIQIRTDSSSGGVTRRRRRLLHS